jgi:hydroxymethylpyrimidine/phosphomethylpyrimidine kinase
MDQQQVKPIIMSIAGLDPSGGAGLAADIEAIAACGGRCAPVISAMTIQNSQQVFDVTTVDADYVLQQAETVLNDLPIAAIKIGLLGSIELIDMLVDLLGNNGEIPIILDPVLASGAGQQFGDEDYIQAIHDQLLGFCTLLTPNQLEARRLSARDDPREAVDDLLSCGVTNLLMTGADVDSEDVINTLHTQDKESRDYFWPRLPGSYHGSGCTLASAAATFIARGLTIDEAVAKAQEFTWHSLKAGQRYSNGQYLPDRSFTVRDNIL